MFSGKKKGSGRPGTPHFGCVGFDFTDEGRKLGHFFFWGAPGGDFFLFVCFKGRAGVRFTQGVVCGRLFGRGLIVGGYKTNKTITKK